LLDQMADTSSSDHTFSMLLAHSQRSQAWFCRWAEKRKQGSWKELLFDLYNCEEMLGTRSRNVAVCSFLIAVTRRHLHDLDRIRLESLEARPRGDENPLALTPRVEVPSEGNGLEVRGPVVFRVPRRQDGYLVRLQATLVGHAP
jgi:hypothetical protein